MSINYPIKLIFCRRKTISLEVLEGIVKVRAPFLSSQSSINNFIKKHELWIMKRVEKFERSKLSEIKFIENEKILIVGKEYTLIFTASNEISSKIVGAKIILKLLKNNFNNKEFIKREFLKIIKEFAITLITKRVNFYSKIIGNNPKSIKISHYKSKWGSCSFKGNLTFNWKIIFAPLEIIDYLVIHELCHLEHHNHSYKFWEKVKKFNKEYLINRKWLKENSIFLMNKLAL